MDAFHERALNSLAQRHTNKILQLTESIRQEIGYIAQRLDSGPVAASSVGHYAQSIATDAQEIVTRLAALEAITDTTAILETRDETEAGPGKFSDYQPAAETGEQR